MPAIAPTATDVERACYGVVDTARTPMNAAGKVSADQIRAALVRANRGALVDGNVVFNHLVTMFGAPVTGYFKVV